MAVDVSVDDGSSSPTAGCAGVLSSPSPSVAAVGIGLVITADGALASEADESCGDVGQPRSHDHSEDELVLQRCGRPAVSVSWPSAISSRKRLTTNSP